MSSPENDEFQRRVSEAVAAFQGWDKKDQDILKRLPSDGLCGMCWGRGIETLKNHYLLCLCPGPPPAVRLVVLEWDQNEGQLKQKSSYLIDQTAIPGAIQGLIDMLYDRPPESE